MEPKRGLRRIKYRKGSSASAHEVLRSLLKEIAMGETRVTLKLSAGRFPSSEEAGKPRKRPRTLDVDAVVDTGAVMLLLPQDIVADLRLPVIDKRIVVLANDQKIEMDIAGPLLLAIGDRRMSADCLVGPPGCEPLVGQLVMEALDLIVDPVRRTLTARPESPYRPTLKLKSLVTA